MSFHPLSGGFGQSLLGVGSTPKIFNLDVSDRQSTELYERRMHGPRNTIIVIIISAMIFILLVSIYDVVRNIINNKYAKIALTNPKSKNTKDDIDRTLIANHQGLLASIIFSTFCMITTIIVLYIISIYKKF